MRVLVTGATGYIGGRLVPRLLAAGHQVRVLVRDGRRIHGRTWSDAVEVHEGDLLRPETLLGLGDGIDAAYYLVHSMGSGSGFAAADEAAAANFVAVMPKVHTIYLGGLLPKTGSSAHLASRARTGEVLSALPTTEFRAGPIIGSGSASFEMVRYLTERLPVMVAPRWIKNDVMPIAIDDVLAYLVGALDKGPLGILSVGAVPRTFRGMMQGYAKVRGLRRLIVPVPVLAPGLAALWVGFVTPIPNRLAVPLVRGIVAPVVADTAMARAAFPDIEPMGYEEAVRLALQGGPDTETRWSGAQGPPDYRLVDWENLHKEVRSAACAASPAALHKAYLALGGKTGWLTWRWAWHLRGAIDRVIGGPGLRRGRRDATTARVGDAIDFWRVEAIDEARLLLRAEMRLPGRAWLEFESVAEDGGSRLVQTAYFEPRGLFGHVYWWSLYWIHRWMFRDLARAIAKRAEGA